MLTKRVIHSNNELTYFSTSLNRYCGDKTTGRRGFGLQVEAEDTVGC